MVLASQQFVPQPEYETMEGKKLSEMGPSP